MSDTDAIQSISGKDTVSVTHLIMLLNDEYEQLLDRHNKIQNLGCMLAYRLSNMYYERLRALESEIGFQPVRPIPYVRWEPTNPAAQSRIFWRRAKYIFDPQKRTNQKNHSESTYWAYHDIKSPRTEKYGTRAFSNAHSYKNEQVRDLAIDTEEVLFLLRKLVSENRRIKNSNADRLNEIEKIKRLAEGYEDKL